MRPYEILLLATLTPLLIVLAAGAASRRLRAGVLVAALAALGLHLALEGSRWTLVPGYGVLVVSTLAVLSGMRLAARRPFRPLRILASGFGFLLVAAAAALSLAFPIVSFPEPDGPYAVGTTTFEVRDTTRAETLTEDPDDVRTFQVRAWYPADSSALADEPVRYRESRRTHHPITAHAPGGGGFPDFMFSHLRHVRVHARLDAEPVDRTRLPVLVFSTGFLSPADNVQVLAEAMASRGWVVLSMTHPYESEAVRHGDGRIVSYSVEQAADYAAHMAMSRPLWERFWSEESIEERRAMVAQIIAEDRFMDRQVRIRSADIRATIDALEDGRAAPPWLLDVMDVRRLAIAGHSLGGATAGQVMVDDARFLTGMNLDGLQFGDLATHAELDRPFVILYSDGFMGVNELVNERLGRHALINFVEGASHADFSDDPTVFPIMRRLGMAGPIEAATMREKLVEFMNSRLLGGVLGGSTAVEVIRGGDRLPLAPVQPRPISPGP